MKEDIQKVISIITSEELSKDKKANKIRIILEKNPDVVDVKIDKEILSMFRAVPMFRIVSLYIDKITLLHLVAQLSYVEEVAKLLIEKGADVNAISGDKFCKTPLHEAACYGNKEVAELLLKNNANIESKDYYGCAPLHYASDRGNEEIVKLLLEKGANVNAVSSDYSGYRETPLHKAMTNSHLNEYLRIVKMLLDYGANAEIEDLVSGTPLHKAVSFGNTEAIKLLLDAGVNVNVRSKGGETPLHVVVDGCLDSLSRGRHETAELLLKYGADVHAKDGNGNTPLHKAALERSQGVAKLLLEHGANVNETNNYGTTPLKMATYRNLFGSINEEIDPKSIIEFFIKQILRKHPSIEKPGFLKKMADSSYWQEAGYSAYWDKHQSS